MHNLFNMGAAASFECQRPVDASDIRQSESVDVALAEVIRLRKMLGHLAKDNGFAEVVYDGSDLVLGINEMEDFERCVTEVAHIRSCLQLATQNSRRRTRGVQYVKYEEADEASSSEPSSSENSDMET